MSAVKRKADGAEEGPAKRSAPSASVQKERIRSLRAGVVKGDGPVIYWMSRDQRMADNWALFHALDQAGTSPVAVAFNLMPEFLGAGARMFGFMLRGLKELEPKLKAANVEFFLLQGDPAQTVPDLVKATGAKLLVTDFSPLRIGRKWRDEVSSKVEIPVHEVDTHNIVPVWTTSNKRETAARTIRPKINGLLPKFLKEFPEIKPAAPWTCDHKPTPVDWDDLIKLALEKGKEVPEVTWCKPGEAAAMDALLGPKGFLTPGRLSQYEAKRNDPCCPQALSGLSPYFHFGQLAPQRAALEASKFKSKYKASVEGFLEEMVVRRELSDNFCFYTPNYDSFDCALDWAKETLTVHAKDKREHLYSQDQLEAAKTHDELWNATQLEMVYHGKMHGYMRMYWAKKILEWTPNAQEAIRIAIYLNDKYELDGRDPNGYVGVMWSMVGIHDQGWAERAVFGKIRYMNYNGCKRKFDVPAYVSYVNRLVKAAKASAGAPTVPSIFEKAAAKAAPAGGKASASSAPAAKAKAAATAGKAGEVKAATQKAPASKPAAKPSTSKPSTAAAQPSIDEALKAAAAAAAAAHKAESKAAAKANVTTVIGAKPTSISKAAGSKTPTKTTVIKKKSDDAGDMETLASLAAGKANGASKADGTIEGGEKADGLEGGVAA